MNSKYKTLLQLHRPFLVRNIIWSPQLADLMRFHGLLTDFMINDINACEKRENSIHKLIDVIPLKGSQNFQKLIEVLMVSGHVFIADFLQEDDEHQKLFDLKDMYKTLPFVQRAFNDKEKEEIGAYMAERIESQVLKLLWKRDNREKDKALEAKMKQIEQAHEFEDQYHDKVETIQRLEKEMNGSLEDKLDLKSKLAALSNAHHEMEAKNKETLQIQMRYNAANDSAIERAKEKIAELESVLKSIHAKVESIPNGSRTRHVSNEKGSKKDHPIVTHKDSKPGINNTAGSQKDNKMATNQFGFLLDDIDSFIKKYDALMDIRACYEKLLEERDYILIHFGFDKTNSGQGCSNSAQDQEPILVRAYKDFALRNDENIMKMKKEIEKCGGLLQENQAKLEDLSREKDDSSKKYALGTSAWQSAIMSVMRKQLQDLKTKLRKKDTVMSMQEEEMGKLKAKISELLQQLNMVQSNQDLPDVGPCETTEGRLSAMSPDSVEMINAENPKPIKLRNLPPLKSPKPNKVMVSPQGTVMRSKPSHFVATTRMSTEAANNYITFPIGPISMPIKPESRGRPMGSVLGDLKAMNKHFNRPMVNDNRTNRKPQDSKSFVKLRQSQD